MQTEPAGALIPVRRGAWRDGDRCAGKYRRRLCATFVTVFLFLYFCFVLVFLILRALLRLSEVGNK